MNWTDRVRALHSFEVLFALFVFSGAFKAAPYFEWIPIDLTVLFGSIAGLIALYLLYTGRIILRRKAAGIISLFAIFVGYAILTGLWSPSESYYLSKSIRLGTATAFSLGGGAIVVSSSRQRIRRFGGAIFGISVAIAIETIYQFTVYGSEELTIFGTNYLITGRVIGFGIILGCYYILIEQPELKRSAPTAVLTLIQLGALGFSGARGPLVTVIGAVGILVLVALSFGNIPRSRGAVAAYLASVAGVSLGAIWVADSIRALRRLFMLVEGPGDSLGTRIDYWIWTIDLISEANIWTGYGLGSWPLYVGLPDEQLYPHNLVLEVVMELGIIGLYLLALVIGYAVYSLIEGWNETRELEYIALMALFAYMLANTFVSGDLNENRYLFAVVGLMVYSPGYPKPVKKVSSLSEMAAQVIE